MSSKKYPSVFNYATQSESRPSELYAYDSRGNLTEKTNAFGQPTFYYYNSRNWLIKEEKPSINVGESAISQRPTTVITYDNVGNRKTVTDPNGNTTSYDYDALNRLVKTTYPSVPCTTGATGANISVENVALTETNEYDANGNRTRHVSTG